MSASLFSPTPAVTKVATSSGSSVNGPDSKTAPYPLENNNGTQPATALAASNALKNVTDNKIAQLPSVIVKDWNKKVAFEYNSLKTFIGDSKEIVIYGWDHCEYEKITHLLAQLTYEDDSNCPINWVGNYGVTETDENRQIDLIKYALREEGQSATRRFKTALTNLLLENIRRIKEHKQIIKVLFIIDIDNNQHPFDVESMLSKDKPHNQRFTNSELRRVCKHCTSDNATIREAAIQTFKFVKLTVQQNSKDDYTLYGFKQATIPYDSPKYQSGIEARKKTSTSTQKPDQFSWRKQLLFHVEKLEAPTGSKTVPANPSSTVISKK